MEGILPQEGANPGAEVGGLGLEDETDQGRNIEANGDDEDAVIDRDPNPPLPPLGPYDAERMRLSDEEREWAIEIKAAVEQTPGLERLTDFLYAQIAIATLVDPTETNLATVLERIAKMQEFQKEHRIPDALETIMSTLARTFQDVVPGHFMSFSYIQSEGSFMVAVDMRKFGNNVLCNPDKLNLWVATAWRLYDAQLPDFDAMRNGVTYLFECSDYDWKNKDMFNVRCTRRITELESIYPGVVHSMNFYNAGMFLNLLLSMSRRMLPSHVTRKFRVSSQDPDRGSLDELFVVPNLEATNQRNLKRIRASLQRRFANEAIFTLGDL